MLEPIIGEVDMVLIMSVNPGYGGQKFIPYALEKIKEVKRLAKAAHREELWIQVDGGVTLSNVKEILDAGANVIVAGSAIFDNKGAKENTEAFMALFNEK